MCIGLSSHSVIGSLCCLQYKKRLNPTRVTHHLFLWPSPLIRKWLSWFSTTLPVAGNSDSHSGERLSQMIMGAISKLARTTWKGEIRSRSNDSLVMVTIFHSPAQNTNLRSMLRSNWNQCQCFWVYAYATSWHCCVLNNLNKKKPYKAPDKTTSSESVCRKVP